MICRICGCEDDAACDFFGVRCYWIEPGLCSGCASIKQVLESRGGLAWVLSIAAGLHELRELMGGQG